jgi:hypothetical protein
MPNGALRASSSRVAQAFLLGALAFALPGAAPTATHRAGDPSLSQDELDALLAPGASRSCSSIQGRSRP